MKIRSLALSSLILVLSLIHGTAAPQPQDKDKTGMPKLGDPLSLDLGGGVKMEMVWIQPGAVMMGSPAMEEGRFDTEIQHRVGISKGFWMGKYEVTQEQWEKIMGSNPSNFKNAQSPVEQVSWDECQTFCQRVSSRLGSAGVTVRLPTEAEWEYACRAGTTTRFNSGDADEMLDRAGWYSGNSGKTTHPVGQKQANAWGLYDMHGNVWEWCQDWYGNYDSREITDPSGPSSGSFRVLRGASWLDDPRYCRSASRRSLAPSSRSSRVGFRVACFR